MEGQRDGNTRSWETGRHIGGREPKIERERKQIVCVEGGLCVCVCVCERETEKEKKKDFKRE